MVESESRQSRIRGTRLILASGSPFRRQLLLDAGWEVEVRVPGIVEPELQAGPGLREALTDLAIQKARAVRRWPARSEIIVAADTVSLAGGRVLGKPADREHARRMLSELSGTAHEVQTGWCLLCEPEGLTVAGCETTELTMREWTSAEIDSYLDSGEWQGKCGAYGLQWPADPFVTALTGSVSNVVGLPLERIGEVLRTLPGWALNFQPSNGP